MEPSDLEMILSTAERILQEAPLADIDRSEGQGAQADALWRTLEDNGFTRICVSEAHGGIGADVSDGLALVGLAGRYALPLPLADTVLAGHILSGAGIAPPEGKIALVMPDGARSRAAFATQCAHVVHLKADGDRAMVQLSINPWGSGLAHSEDGVGEIDVDALCAISAAPTMFDARAYRALGALSRASAMAGAMQSVLELTLAYTSEREQFGRPLAKFQAIQHHLSDMACETAAAAAAVELALDAIAADLQIGTATIHESAVAKIRCGLAASKVAAGAHQAHGALGFTREYALGRYTRRLWQWQDDFGSDSDWSIDLGRAVLKDAENGIWAGLSAE